jgi:hypothetical protein
LASLNPHRTCATSGNTNDRNQSAHVTSNHRIDSTIHIYRGFLDV